MSVEIVREKPIRLPQAKYVEFKSASGEGGKSIQHVRITENTIQFLSGLIELTPGYCGNGGKFFVNPRILRELCQKITEFLDEKERT